MRHARTGAILAVAALAAVLGGCSASSIADRLPSEIGESAAMPARPTTAYQYPAVHDMPPARPDQPLSEEQQVQMEKDLESTRKKQEVQTGTLPPKSDKKTAADAKKQTPAANDSQTDGGKPNP
jgi:hypothetical protein